MSLYENLDLTRDADAAAIKAAYRRKAKNAHPDVAGDNGEKFRQLQVAYDVLRDPDKRAFYDQTGVVPGGDSDEDGARWQFLAQLIIKVVMGPSGEAADIMGAVIQQLQAELVGVVQQITNGTAAIAKFERVRKRLSRKKKRGQDQPDVVGIVLDREIATARQNLLGLERQRDNHTKLIEMAREYRYDRPAGGEMAGYTSMPLYMGGRPW